MLGAIFRFAIAGFVSAAGLAQAAETYQEASPQIVVPVTDIPAPALAITGKPEVVMTFSASTGCSGKDGADTPDANPFAFRREDGKVVLFASNSRNFVSVGEGLDNVSRIPCTKSFITPQTSSDPSDYRGRMWLMAVIQAPDGTMLGFIHNEYHGELYFPNDCHGQRQGGLNCWYGSSLIATSRDGGKSFQLPTDRSYVLASPPFKFSVGQGRVGYVSPIPLSQRQGDATPNMYVFIVATKGKPGTPRTTTTGKTGTCIMRGPDADPSHWRMWSGSDFDITVARPYADPTNRPSEHVCTPVLPFILGAVKYVPMLKQYVAVGTDSTSVLYSYSRDLVHWTLPQVLVTYSNINSKGAGASARTAYYSLLDPTSTTRSFETLEQTPYLYYVEFIKPGDVPGPENARRLMRVRIGFR
ncbi:MAG: hypothetical protein HYX36_07430 [Rhizobiales bacterium]|nr:hypothetical protein [Hyphomicrobiales bacterium]